MFSGTRNGDKYLAIIMNAIEFLKIRDDVNEWISNNIPDTIIDGIVITFNNEHDYLLFKIRWF